MEKNALAIIAVLTLTSIVAANVEKAEPVSALPDISQGWKFKLGDNPSWSNPLLDDSDWRPIRLGTTWEKQGFPDYDGYAWYRIHVRIPKNLQNLPSFQLHQSLSLTLGKIDDVDQTWFNGKVIGKTGEFPDLYKPAWLATRVYTIPAALIHWDSDNVLAVRVYDGSGEGGLYEGPFRLAVITLGDLLEFDFDWGRNDGIFSNQKGLPISARLHNKARVAVVGKVHWIIKDDEGSTLSTESAAIKIPSQTASHITSRFTPTTPGFYQVTCTIQSAKKDVNTSTTIILGYRPEAIQSALTRQKDFDEFWRKTLAALEAVKPQFKMDRRSALDSQTHEVYEVEMHSLGGIRVRGWYEKPIAEGKRPALLRVPGYSSSMRPSGSSDPMAIFSFNIRGHGNSQDDVKGTPENYWIRGLDDKQGYFYQGAYADCVRAVDFLASRTEVDIRRIAVTGASQGGGLSLATAALDRRVSLCAPDIPFLCDWVKYFKTSQWPEIDEWIKARPHRSWKKTLRTMSYFDALNFADRITCPVFLGLGLQDEVCPAATIFSVYNRITTPKEFHVYPKAKHWVDTSHHDERREWIRKHFQGGK
jgi:cephalosporin-C deacetylase